MTLFNNYRKGTLHLEDGTRFEGYIIGKSKNVSGEVVFTTGMVGYPEALTDPSYYGQILIFTYPIIGNYGIPSASDNKNFESERIQVSGIILSECIKNPSNATAVKKLEEWLFENNLGGLAGVDTRGLTLYLRSKGVMPGKIIVDGKEKDFPYKDINKMDLVTKISTRRCITYPEVKNSVLNQKNNFKIGLIDCGVKLSIIRALRELGAIVVKLPYDWEDFDSFDGLLISNGPGDPKKVIKTIKNIQQMLKKDKPILGICLGSQIMALAAGADTYKLPYGHRSHNQPVLNRLTNKAYLTTQNHGYAVRTESLKQDWEEWFVNLNDQTNEGIKHKSKPFYAVQFHPEGNPGPEDTNWIFKEFIQRCKKF